MQAIKALEANYSKPKLPQIQSGDTVRVHQLIKEGNKSRTQIFEGVVIRTSRLGELSATIAVRRIASGVGVEKTFLLHSPKIGKIEVVRRTKVRRNFLSYLRARRGKSARLKEMAFDKLLANVADEPAAVATDDTSDTEVTELSDDAPAEAEVVEPIDAVIEQENKDAASDDEQGSATENEAQLPAEEVQGKLDQANAEDQK